MKKQTLLLAMLSLLPAIAASTQQALTQPSSILLSGGIVADGTGAKRRLVDVRVAGVESRNSASSNRGPANG